VTDKWTDSKKSGTGKNKGQESRSERRNGSKGR
jgi:hypothetical protein